MKDEALDLKLFDTSGWSMWPFLKGGEKILTRKARMSDLKTGDLILYREKEKLVCHRLVKIDLRGEVPVMYLRGDTFFAEDMCISEEFFEGKVVGIIGKNKIRRLDSFSGGLINKVLIVVAPLVNIFVRRFQSILKNR